MDYGSCKSRVGAALARMTGSAFADDINAVTSPTSNSCNSASINTSSTSAGTCATPDEFFKVGTCAARDTAPQRGRVVAEIETKLWSWCFPDRWRTPMSTGKFVGRVGALAVALGVGFTTGAAPGVP